MSNLHPVGPPDRHTLRLSDIKALRTAKELEARLRSAGRLVTRRIGSAVWTTNNPDFIASCLKLNTQAQEGRCNSAQRTMAETNKKKQRSSKPYEPKNINY